MRIFLIEEFWVDSMESRNNMGWKPAGFVTSEKEAKRIVEVDPYLVCRNRFPLMYAPHREGDLVSRYRYSEIKEVSR